MNRLFPFSCGLLSALIVVLAPAGCRKQPEAVVQPERRVVVTPAVLTRELPPIEAPGVLSRKLEVTLSFKIGGVVDAVLVRPGEAVQAGQVLARLNSAEIDAQVAQAQAAVDKARRDCARVERLQADRVATLESLQNARTAVEAAEAGLQIAEFNRRYATIEAPGPGRILRRMAEPGELATPGQAVLVFGSDREGWIFRAGVVERDARRLAPGDSARLIFRGPPDLELDAAVTQIADAADPRTRTFEVELAVAGDPHGLRSGTVGALAIGKPGAALHTQVPLSALIEGDGRTAQVFLLKADGRTVHRQAVDVETVWGDSALLAALLPAGARVVSLGAEYLHDGETVVVSSAPAAR
jgi:RND family efflux transporter MFP subunit